MAAGNAQPVGKAVIVYGTVKAVSAGGFERTLTPNSIIYAHERIVTGPDGSISIAFTHNPAQLVLGRMSDVVIDEEVYAAGEAGDSVAQVEDIQTALQQDENFDPTVDLPAPAAGAAGIGADNDSDIDSATFASIAITGLGINGTLRHNGVDGSGAERSDRSPDCRRHFLTTLQPTLRQGFGTLYEKSLHRIRLCCRNSAPLFLGFDPFDNNPDVKAVCHVAQCADKEMAVALLVMQLVGDCPVDLDVIGEQ